MTTPVRELRRSRTAANYHWTDTKALAFLDALAHHGKVAAGARAVGMTRQSAYRLKQRVPIIARAWERAQALGRARRRSGRPKASLWRAHNDRSDAAK